jgi:hypothetical protein
MHRGKLQQHYFEFLLNEHESLVYIGDANALVGEQITFEEKINNTYTGRKLVANVLKKFYQTMDGEYVLEVVRA